MLITEPDHFVIAARTLQEGIDYIHSKLGVVIPKGGEHPRMGTHNHLMSLGNTFLEVIAINPDQKPQRTPRWFDLDSTGMQNKLAQSPQLITWVARTNNIEKAVDQTSINLGKIETVSRGNLTWKITVPEDGSLPENGIFPTLIQWPDGVKPWESMQNMGYSFQKLFLTHTFSETIQENLQNIGLGYKRIEITNTNSSTLKLALKNPENKLTTI